MATSVSSSSLVKVDSTSPLQSLHLRNFSTIQASSPAHSNAEYQAVLLSRAPSDRYL